MRENGAGPGSSGLSWRETRMTEVVRAAAGCGPRRRLTQAVQSGVRLLSPWAGGLVFAAWAAAFAITGAVVTARTDIT